MRPLPPEVPTPAPGLDDEVLVACFCGLEMRKFSIKRVRAGTCGWSCRPGCRVLRR